MSIHTHAHMQMYVCSHIHIIYKKYINIYIRKRILLNHAQMSLFMDEVDFIM